MAEQKVWKNCSTCKKPIYMGSKYYVCSVSTCNGQRTGYVFCSMQCFESHLPGARHRDAGAIEKSAPRLIVAGAQTTQVSSKPAIPKEVLIIASRLKEYIQARADYNTSASVMDVLSEHIRLICDRAIDNARAEGRKTLMDRDFDFLFK
jgi:histone H3/H4